MLTAGNHVADPLLLTPLTQFDFTLTEVDDFVGGDGSIKKKAMLVNGENNDSGC